jgi:peptide/nickel transport system permease protein
VLRGIGWSGLGLIAIAVVLSDFLARAPADATNVGPMLASPTSDFPFGTDLLGRDVLSETLHALSVTAGHAASAMVMALLAGGMLGFAAARLPHYAGLALRGFVGIFAGVPALLLAILFIGLTNRDLASLAAGLAAAPLAFARAFDRASAYAATPYAEYGIATGISTATLLRRDLVYEIRDTLLPTAARALAAVTIILSTVSYLGFGAVPPHRDLGLLVAAAKASYLHGWWTAAFPAAALLVLILFARLAAGLDEGERP